MYEVGMETRLRAIHVMPGAEGPEGSPHAHEYRCQAVVERRSLDDRGMVCDLDVLQAALGDAVGRVEGKDLEAIRPEGVEAVTVEVFARWMHGALAPSVAAGGGQTLAIRMWESEVAFGGYRAPVT
jgi:6-pyruvoyltetrahydropterin/6-carboxytetrahydropterin synthase